MFVLINADEVEHLFPGSKQKAFEEKMKKIDADRTAVKQLAATKAKAERHMLIADMFVEDEDYV